MRIRCDKTGRITESEPRLQEGLNVLGRIHGVCNDAFELERISSMEQLREVSPARIDAAGPIVFIRKGGLAWAAPDITATRDLFYGKTPAGDWLIVDNLFSLAQEFPSLKVSRRLLLYFVRHGFLPAGEMFFPELRRVRVGSKLLFDKGIAREEETWSQDRLPRTYEGFKRAFSSVFEVYPFGQEAAISLSAGADSGLVAAVAVLKYGKRPLAITLVNPNQPLQINDIDAANAARVARYYGLEHALLELDWNNLRAERIKDVVGAMPLGAQLSLHHFLIGGEAARRGIKQLWHGEAADSVYNLGPTHKSWGGPLRRFYLTKEYWQGFPDIAGNRLVGSATRAFGQLGPLAWRAVHGQALRQPASFRELMDAFAAAEGTPPFPPKNAEKPNAFPEKLTTRQAREAFFDWKTRSFLPGRSLRIRYVVADHFGFEAAVPYTATNMLWFFRGLEMNWKDVFAPKRFIYRYLQELLGEKAYRDLYVHQEQRLPQRGSSLTWRQWQENMLSDTLVGQELREKAREALARFPKKLDCNLADVQHVLGLVWVHYVFAELEELGVAIEIIEDGLS